MSKTYLRDQAISEVHQLTRQGPRSLSAADEILLTSCRNTEVRCGCGAAPDTATGTAFSIFLLNRIVASLLNSLPGGPGLRRQGPLLCPAPLCLIPNTLLWYGSIANQRPPFPLRAKAAPREGGDCWRFVRRRSSDKPSGAEPSVILCVDDEIVPLFVRKHVLERSGYSVLTATNTEDALEKFKANPVDLVLTDHLLLCSSGIALAAEMKKLKPEVPVAILSGLSEIPADVGHAVCFITRLAATPELLSNIEELLTIHRQENRLPCSY